MSEPNRIIGVDPGRTTGLAEVWRVGETWRLTAFGSIDLSKSDGLGLLPRVFHAGEGGEAAEVVVEVPRWRRYGNPGDPNDLLKLAKRAGMVIEYYRGGASGIVEVFPEDWKGGVAKRVHHERLMAALTSEELHLLTAGSKRVSKANPHGVDNNELDAVGIALWRCGRLPRGG
jgi:hypothetical protein